MSQLYRNGKSADLETFISGAHLGHGVFETFVLNISEENGEKVGRVLALDLHLERLQRGIDAFSLSKISFNQIYDLLSEIAKNHTSSLRIRIVAYIKDWYLTVVELEDNVPDPVSVVSYKTERSFPEFKSCSAIVSVMASRFAASQKAFEALLVDHSNIVREGAWSNFFWFDKTGDLYTQPNKILPGITRELILRGSPSYFNVQMKEVTWEELLDKCEFIFLTQSTRGLIAVNKIANKQLIPANQHDLFLSIKEYYQGLCSDRI